MRWTRRELLCHAAAAPVLSCLATPALVAAPKPKPMGIVLHSYHLRRAADKDRPASERIDDPLTFLEYCRQLGAGGVQIALGARDEAYAAKLRQRADAAGLYLEGSVQLPRDKHDLERFTAEVRFAGRCGASVLRTTLMNGRRYEVFDTVEAYRRFREDSGRSLALAGPIAEKHGVKLAVENHKDLQAEELVDLIKKIGRASVGVCVDTGNNLALLETSEKVAATLAPYALSSHIKDMGVEEYADGFLLAEVPLGRGILDLPMILATLRRARPELRFNLEMMTRDPLRVPCLTRKYWMTFADVSGRRLAEMLTLVRARAAKQPLPRISDRTPEERLKLEDDQVRESLRYARERLGL